jgi:hypothetical protein
VDGKLQVVPKVGEAKEKFAAFVPVILCAVIVAEEALVLTTAMFATGEVVPRNVVSEIGFGLKMIVPGLMVKLIENPGVGPPPGTGFVMVPDTVIAVVRNEAGTGISKTVPFELAVPPVRGKLPNVVKVTVVPFTKCDPVKCIV